MYKQLSDFMEEHVYPNEAEFNRHQASEHCWTPHPLVEEIKVVLIIVNNVPVHREVLSVSLSVNDFRYSYSLMYIMWAELNCVDK